MRLVLGLSIALLMVSSPVSGESEDHMRVGLETLLERVPEVSNMYCG